VKHTRSTAPGWEALNKQTSRPTSLTVAPAKAGAQMPGPEPWIPAFAGMTNPGFF